jgi:Ca-activated chloride channel family protein
VPFALFLLAFCSLTMALARPVRIVPVPTGQATIMLTIDVSGSMRQSDIQPTRLEAAQAAALSFIQRQPATTQFGVVAFAEYAELIQPPTSDRDALRLAIESLTTGRATAIGDGILTSLDAIASIDHNIAPSVADPSSSAEPPPVPKGDYAPHIIVLLTDGVANAGMLPLDAAHEAEDRGVRVYTIGFGTAQGSRDFGQGGFGGGFGPPPGGGGFGQGQSGGGRGFGGRFRRGIDETTLKQIASMTGAKYYAASSADELLKVFQSLPTSLITKHEVMEISVVFAAIGALLVTLAMGLSLRWNPLP